MCTRAQKPSPSTTNLYNRKSAHKTACKNENNKAHNYNVYQFIRANGGWANWDVVVVEDYPCDSKNQLETRERHHMEDLGATLNRHVPTRTKKQYNKQYHKEQQKQYDKKNYEKIKKYNTAKIPCPHCNKILSRGSLYLHIKRKHTK